jgi:hypothetical protein
MTDPQVLVGRVVGRAIQRGEHIFLLFFVPGRRTSSRFGCTCRWTEK